MVGDITFQKMYGLYVLKHHIVEISGDVTDAGRTNERQAKIWLLSFSSANRRVSQQPFLVVFKVHTSSMIFIDVDAWSNSKGGIGVGVPYLPFLHTK